ncbi:MAG: hypothetical protein HZB16_13140 [Armatimonadetes bacterium]|nr:hypothetical protein [Armatimonadota bacterium]
MWRTRLLSFMGLIVVLALLAGGVLVLVALLTGGAPGSAANRRWARVAQRRAPVAPRSRRDSASSELLDHVDRQLSALLSERHRVGLLLGRGEQLRRRLLGSEQFRSRLESLDQQIELLWRKARHLDGLVGRYQRHRDELALLAETAEFGRMVADYEAESSVDARWAGLSEPTDELDEEATRLLDVVEAEDELTAMLRG